jgi:hypothetical protein
VSVTTLTAFPRPYIEHVQTCRTREGLAAAACSRCVLLADDEYASAGPMAFILQLRFEHPPTRIEHGLGHPGLREFETTDIADDYRLILVNNPS